MEEKIDFDKPIMLEENTNNKSENMNEATSEASGESLGDKAKGVFKNFNLLAPTEDKPLEDYRNHVLNFNKSTAMCRIIRGIQGIAGELNLALFDIVVGIYEFRKPKKDVGIFGEQL